MSDVCVAIEGFVSADGCAPVRVVIDGGEEWDRRKALELIKAARMVYEALGYASAHIAMVDPNWEGLIDLERAQAAACGAVLMQDRMAAGREKGKKS